MADISKHQGALKKTAAAFRAGVLGLSMVPAIVVLSIAPIGVHAEEPNRRFDGAWDTILSCINSNGALGYSFEFVSTVKDGVLHGEKGEQRKPGWLSLDGNILEDGSATFEKHK